MYLHFYNYITTLMYARSCIHFEIFAVQENCVDNEKREEKTQGQE